VIAVEEKLDNDPTLGTLFSVDPMETAAYLSPIWLANLDSKGRYGIPRHLEFIDRKLRELEAGKIDRLAVMMPPRHGKSTLCSKYFPAWFLGRHPEKRIVLVSYEADFAARWGRAARDVMELWGGPLFGFGVRKDTRAANRWGISNRHGGMDTAGVGGAITGKGADCLIIDDPVKNAKDALSPVYRRHAWDWWHSTAQTRLEPKGKVVAIGTRWHQEDLIGMMLANEPDRWEVVRLPAIAEEGDQLGREPGEALWPERYPAEKLEEIFNSYEHDEAQLGPYWKQALYDQNPVPPEGAIFKRQWLRYFNEDADHYLLNGENGDKEAVRKDNCIRFITCDLAVSTSEQADFFCLGCWILSNDRRWLLLDDCVHERLEGPDQPGVIKRLYARDKPFIVWVESNAYQLSLVQGLLREGLRVQGVRADRDKVARAHGAATRFSAGSISFRQNAPWLRELEEELLNFPGSRHDDYVDMITMAVNQVSSMIMPRAY
jgi:predicted phage terminase large subunit-like protein